MEQAVGAAHKCGCYDSCLTEEFGVDSYLNLCGTTLQPLNLLVETVIATMAMVAHFAYCLAQLPQVGIVGMCLKAALIGKTEHLVVDATWVADAQNVNSAVDKLL